MQLTSNTKDIVIKGGQRCFLRPSGTPGVYKGSSRIIGTKAQTNGILTAIVDGYDPANCTVHVREKEDSSHIKFEFKPDEDYYGSVRYKWDIDNPYVLRIAAKHPSIRQYLGYPQDNEYPGKDSSLYHSVLAEVIAEALTFNLMERQFRIEGEQGKLDFATMDSNFHKYYSEFLVFCHKDLNSDNELTPIQSKLL